MDKVKTIAEKREKQMNILKYDPNLPHKVADISLADWGRKEMNLARNEMPGLMAIRQKYGSQKPLKNLKITGSLHMTIQTAMLIGKLESLTLLAVLTFSIKSARYNYPTEPVVVG
jgi:hypothetical protein